MNTTTKRAATIGAGAALCLLVGGAAFAYWTTTGSGSGSAATGDVSAVTIVATSPTVSGLYPGGPAQAVSGNFNNPNPGSVYINQVTVTISAVSPSQSNTNLPACTAADFTVVQPGATAAQIPSGTGVGSWTGSSIALKNTSANQDNCKNVSLTLSFTSN